MSAIEPVDPVLRRQELLTCPRWVLEKLAAASDKQRRDEESIAALSTQLRQYGAEVERLQSVQAALTLTPTHQRLQVVEAALQTHQRERESLIAECQQRELFLTKQIQDAQARTTELATANAELTARNTELTSQVGELTARIQTLERDRETMIAENAAKDLRIAEQLRQTKVAVSQLMRRSQSLNAEEIQRAREQGQSPRTPPHQQQSLSTSPPPPPSTSCSPPNDSLLRSHSSNLVFSDSPTNGVDPTGSPSLIPSLALSRQSSLPSFSLTPQRSPSPTPLSPSSLSTLSSFSPIPSSSSSSSLLSAALASPLSTSSSSSSLTSQTSTTSSSSSSTSSSTSTSSSSASTSSSTYPLVNALSTNEPLLVLKGGQGLTELMGASPCVRLATLRHLVDHHTPELIDDLEALLKKKLVSISFSDHHIRYLIWNANEAGLLAALKTCTEGEVAQCLEISTLGRGNNIRVRFLANVPRLFGRQVLSDLLSPLFAAVIDNALSFEANEHQCLQLLEDLLNNLSTAIDNNAIHPIIGITARFLVDSVEAHIDRLGEVGPHVALAGFWILRFICPVVTVPSTASPAILTPAQEARMKETPALAKTFMNLGRLLQSAANRTASKSASSPAVDDWLARAGDRLALILQRLPVPAPFDAQTCLANAQHDVDGSSSSGDDALPRYKLTLEALKQPGDTLDSILTDMVATITPRNEPLTLSASASSTATAATASSSSSTTTTFNIPVADFLLACSSKDISSTIPDTDFLNAIFSLFPSHDKYLDALIESNANQPSVLAEAFVYLNAHFSPRSLCDNIALVLEGEVLQGTEFHDSVMYHFLISCFKYLLRDRFRAHFQPIISSLISSGRNLLIDANRLTPAELKELPARVTALTNLTSELLRALVVLLKEAPYPLWYCFKFLYDNTLPTPPSMSITAVAVSFALWLLQELESLGLTEKALSAASKLAIAAASDMLRAAGGDFVKVDPRVLSQPAYQQFIQNIPNEISSALLAWCTGPDPPFKLLDIQPNSAQTLNQLQRFRTALRGCSDAQKYAAPNEQLLAAIAGQRQDLVCSLAVV